MLKNGCKSPDQTHLLPCVAQVAVISHRITGFSGIGRENRAILH